MSDIEEYIKNTLVVKVMTVTESNMVRVAIWCGGKVVDSPNGDYVHVPVKKPQRDSQTRAFVGTLVLKSDEGFKVYTKNAFHRAFTKRDLGMCGSAFAYDNGEGWLYCDKPQGHRLGVDAVPCG